MKSPMNSMENLQKQVIIITMMMVITIYCQNKNETRTQTLGVGAILGILYGSIAGFVIFIIVLCCCCCNKKRNIEKSYNNVDPGSMTIDQFDRNKIFIIRALNSMQKFPTNFAFFVKKQAFFNIVSKIQITKQKPFFTQIKLQGKDHIGEWKAKGSILCRNGQMFFWMFKDFVDRTKAKQRGAFQHIVYDTISFNAKKGLVGNWFYHGHEKDPRYSGKWQIAFNFDRSSANVQLQEIKGQQYYGNDPKTIPISAGHMNNEVKGIQIQL